MPLDFTFKNCAKLPDGSNVYDDPHDPEQWHPVATALVWGAAAIGMRDITDENATKFFDRLSVYQRVTGPAISLGEGVRVYITLADVKLFIGTETNASEKTDTQWAKSLIAIADNYRVGNGNALRKPLPPEYIGKSAYDIWTLHAAKHQKA